MLQHVFELILFYDEMYSIVSIQLSVHICGFHILRFNQPRIENTKKTNSRKFQKAKIKFVACQQLF